MNGHDVKRTILLVEDEALIAMNEAAVLARYGFEVMTAYSAQAAVETARSKSIDLILMDIDLGHGRMDGTEAAEIILREKDIPVVFLSSHIEPEVVEKTEGITSYGYIVKNSGETVVLASIKMAFRLFEAKMREKEHKQALVHSHDLLSYIIEHNQSAIAVHDRDLKYIYVSKQYLNQYNVEKRNIIGKHHYEIFPDLPEKWKEVHRKALAGTVSTGEEDPYERDDGTIDWTRWECRPWYEADGSIGGIIIYTEVVSKEKQITANTRDTINYLQSILRTTPDGFWMMDLLGNILDVNNAFCKMTGYARGEIIRTNIQDITAAEKSEVSADRIQHIISAGNEIFQLRFRGKRGRIFDAEISASFFGGEADRIICFCRDITGRRKAEEDVETGKKFFTSIVENIPNMVFLKEAENLTFYLVNRAAEEIIGMNREELIGKSDYDIFPKHEADFFRKKDLEVINGRKEVVIQEEELAASDQIRYLYTKKVPIFDDQEAPRYLLGISEDITDLKRALDEKDFLMKEIDHRVKNNLMMITSLISLKSASLGDSVDLTDLKNQIDAIRIVHEKLYTAENLARINFTEYAEDLLATIFSSFTDRPVQVHTKILQETLTAKTAVPLGLIVNELATNAIKHGFIAGEPARFTVAFVPDTRQKQYILTVSNNGRPFPEDLELTGSGTLGLQLISALVSQLNGTLSLERKPSPVFTITFPVEAE